MGFSAKQVQTLRRKLDHRHVRTARPTDASSLISRDGTPSQKPTGSLASMAGTGNRRISLRACARKSRFLPRCLYCPGTDTVQAGGTTIIREGHGSGEGHTPRPVRCTIPRSRPQKPMPPNGRWRLSDDRSGLSSIARKGTHRCSGRPFAPATASPPTQPRLGLHPDDMTPIPRPSHYSWATAPESMTELLRHDQAKPQEHAAAAPALAPVVSASTPSKIDKSACHRRIQAPARQGAPEICCLTTVSGLRTATI